MHRTTITDAALIEAVLFSTVCEMPADEPIIWQIIEVLLMLGILIYLIEYARRWESSRKKKVRRAATQTDKK